MEFCELTTKEFDEFAQASSCDNFMQTSNMYHHLQAMGHGTYLVGMKDQGKVVAATLLDCNQVILKYKTFKAHKGFLIDYSNQALLEEFTRSVQKFVKNKKGYRLVIDPYCVNIQRNIDGQIVPGGLDQRFISENLKKLGFTSLAHGGQVKWTFVLDVEGKTSQQLLSEMKTNTKRSINKTIERYKLRIRKLDYDDLSEFKKITQDTSDRRNFSDKSLQYYQSMFKNYKDKIQFLIVELVIGDYLEQIELDIQNNKEKLEKFKDQSRIEAAKLEIERLLNHKDEALELQKIHGNRIVLSGAMFLTYGSETVYLFSGSYDEFMSFNGQYRIQWEIIQYALAHGYKRHNFYGVRDIFDPKSKNYGVYAFKKTFNGYVEELVGAFEIKTSWVYPIIKLVKKIKQ